MTTRKKHPLDKKKAKFLDEIRYYTTTMSLVILNLNVFGFSLKQVCSPGFNCHGCSWATCACPIGVFAHGFSVRQIPYLAIGTILAIGVVLGRLVCSFACPFGLFQDLMFRIPGAKFKIPRAFRYVKYLALLLLVIVLPFVFGLKHSGFMKVITDKNTLSPQGVSVSVENLGDQPVVAPIVELRYEPQAPIEGAGHTAMEGGNAETSSDGLTIGTDDKGFPTATMVFRDVVVEPKQTVKLPIIAFPNCTSDAELQIRVYSEANTNNIPIPDPKVQAYYCLHCPAGALTASLPKAIGAAMGDDDAEADPDAEVTGGEFYSASFFEWKFGLLLIFLVLMWLTSRPFCQTFCPLGAIYGLCTPLAISQMKFNPNSCNACGMCDRVCPMDLNVRKEVGGMECIACGNCQKICSRNAVVRRFGFKSTTSVVADAKTETVES